MHLLICVIDRKDQLEAVLAGLVDLGVTGATLIDSQGVGRTLSKLPVFAGLKSMLGDPRPANTTLLSVIDSEATLDRAIAHVRRICGDFEEAGSGILFTVPVDRVVGLAPKVAPSGRGGPQSS